MGDWIRVHEMWLAVGEEEKQEILPRGIAMRGGIWYNMRCC